MAPVGLAVRDADPADFPSPNGGLKIRDRTQMPLGFRTARVGQCERRCLALERGPGRQRACKILQGGRVGMRSHATPKFG